MYKNAPQPQKRPITAPSNAFDPDKESEANAAYLRSEAWHKEFYKSGACPYCGLKIINDLDVCDCPGYRAELKKDIRGLKAGVK
jgi:hypothetical protein